MPAVRSAPGGYRRPKAAPTGAAPIRAGRLQRRAPRAPVRPRTANPPGDFAIMGGGVPAPAPEPAFGPTGPSISAPGGYTAGGYAPSLLDIDAISRRFDPDAGILAGYEGRLGRIGEQTTAARGEAERQKGFAVGQVGQIAPMAQGIYDPILANVGRAGGAAGQAAAAALGGSFAPTVGTELGAFETAAKLGQAGFQQQQPLLEAGFGENLARQLSALQQADVGARGEVESERQGYLQQLAGQRAEAVTQAEAANAAAQAEAAAFGASARNQAARAGAEGGGGAGDFGDVTERERFEYEKEQDLLAQEPEAAEPAFDILATAKQYRPSAKEVSGERGASLTANGVTARSLTGNSRKAYDSFIQRIAGMPPDQAQAELQKDPNRAKYPQALSLAIWDSLGASGVNLDILGTGATARGGGGLRQAKRPAAVKPGARRAPAKTAPKKGPSEADKRAKATATSRLSRKPTGTAQDRRERASAQSTLNRLR